MVSHQAHMHMSRGMAQLGATSECGVCCLLRVLDIYNIYIV